METFAHHRGFDGSAAGGWTQAKHGAPLGSGKALCEASGARRSLQHRAADLVFSAGHYETSPPRAGTAHRGTAAFPRESVTVARDASMSAPFVTVLIDTYNYGQYIEEAVESVLTQEFPREQREILVVDDGSTDDTAERLKKYSDEIRYVRKPNGG